jgi:hypothetical protein
VCRFWTLFASKSRNPSGVPRYEPPTSHKTPINDLGEMPGAALPGDRCGARSLCLVFEG